jgi:predicted permease
MTGDEARLAARRALGSIALAKDRHRDARSIVSLEDVGRDLRCAVRTMRRSPAWTATVTLTLALGIGAATATFSVVYAGLLRPLPYPASDRLVRVWELHQGATTIQPGMQWLSNVTYHAWRENSRTMEAIGTFSSGTRTVRFDRVERMGSSALSPSAFAVLRVTPMLGRFFVEADAEEAIPPVVLSAGLWQERFGGRASAIGQTLIIGDRPHVIVGVAPADFGFPSRDERFWIPEFVPHSASADGQPRVVGASVIARLANGVTPQQAAAEGTAIARSQPRPPVTEILWGKGGPVDVHVRPLTADLTASVQPAFILALAAVSCLLLIACANTANLLLARGVSREREMAVRTALGAARGRLVGQLLIESVVMSAVAGALGAALAFGVIRVMPLVVPRRFPRVDDIRVDGAMLIIAVTVTVVAAVLSGLAPALRGVRRDIVPSLREGAGASAGARTGRLRRLLLTSEAALAVLLLVVALLVARSLGALLHVDAGYDANNVVAARVYLAARQPDQQETDPFIAALLDRVRSLAGVTAAGAGGMAPFSQINVGTQLTVAVPGRAPVSARSRVYVVTPGYAEALRLRLRAGRLLNESDLASGLQVMLVNEDFVRTFLQDVEPIGFETDSILTRGTRARVVGVVGNVLKEGLNAVSQPEVYIVPAHRYLLAGEVQVLARTDGDPAPIASALRKVVAALRSDIPIDNVTTLRTETLESVGGERLITVTLAGLAVMAVLLAAIGLYGVLSHVVSGRQRELGVLAALGASSGRIARLVIGDGMRTTGVGLMIGLALAAGVARLMSSMLFGIQPLDPLSFGLAAVVLIVVALIACALPARRAARVDPLVALRTD